MSLSDLLETVVRALLAQVWPICVCRSCVHASDKMLGPAGDFSICERCQASITSKTGCTVRAGGTP